MKKRLISLGIAVVLISTTLFTVSMAENAQTTAVINRLEAIEIINYGILSQSEPDGGYKYLANDFITRVELACMIYCYTGAGVISRKPFIEPVITYDDIQPDHWAFWYISSATFQFAFSRDDKLFRPNDDVTYIEALKAVIGHCGYTPLARALSETDFGYTSLANILKLTDGMSKYKTDEKITKGDLAILINNSLDLYKIVHDMDYSNPFVQDGETLWGGGEPFYDDEDILEPTKVLDYVNVQSKQLYDPMPLGKPSDLNIKMQINSDKFSVNGEEKKMDTAPIIIDGRTMVPIRFITENIPNCGISWNRENQEIEIQYKN